ncbi:CU044_5270 family protein [Micromonosporaceae bacterium B7E4]
MNPTPVQPDPTDRAELARLLPPPVERDLPGERHLRLQEFVMSQIHQDLPAGGPARSRRPGRRLVLVASALVAAVVAATGVGALAVGDGTGNPGQGRVVSALPGNQILLVAATTAEQASTGTGDYWYLKVTSSGTAGTEPHEYEYWIHRDGRTWFRAEKSKGEVIGLNHTTAWRVGGVELSLDQLEGLPTDPAALRSWITTAVRDADIRTSAGPANAEVRERLVFNGLISLVSQLPAPPKVRAAAFRAIAGYPGVESLGVVEGGQGLRIALPDGSKARLVVDPATSRIRETNFFVTLDGGEAGFSGKGADEATYQLVAEWTEKLPG